MQDDDDDDDDDNDDHDDDDDDVSIRLISPNKYSAFYSVQITKKLEKYTKLPSRHEAFNNDKPAWISDKLFTQQRLAGTNPMSIQRVANHDEGRPVTLVTNNTPQYLRCYKKKLTRM